MKLSVHSVSLLAVEVIEELRNDAENARNNGKNGAHPEERILGLLGLVAEACALDVADPRKDGCLDGLTDGGDELCGKSLCNARHTLGTVAVLPLAVVDGFVSHLLGNDLFDAVEEHPNGLAEHESGDHCAELLIILVYRADDENAGHKQVINMGADYPQSLS